jgi:hypothetical protein
MEEDGMLGATMETLTDSQSLLHMEASMTQIQAQKQVEDAKSEEETELQFEIQEGITCWQILAVPPKHGTLLQKKKHIRQVSKYTKEAQGIRLRELDEEYFGHDKQQIGYTQ